MSATTTGFGSSLLAQHQAKLESSAITPEVAAERGYVSAEQKAELDRHGFALGQRRPPALVIPLWGVTGERWGAQVRPDDPRLLSGKAAKYETAAGTKMALDVPPRVRQHLADTSRPLVVTEGPLKADAAVSAGLDAVALLGVWNWKSGGVVLPDIEYVALKGRRVVVAFDSDAILKPQVHEAMGRLGAVLAHRGAEVLFAYLPAGPAGAKIGLDDWLAAGGTADALWELCSPELRRLAGTEDTGEEDIDTYDDVDEEPGAALIADVAHLLRRFVVFPSEHAQIAAALWVVHAHAADCAESTPRLAVLSPEKQSGKTRLLEVLELLVPRPLRPANMTAAALYRMIAARQPTVLFDEIDATFGPKAGDHEELRAVLNAGHRRGATVARCVGDGASMEVVEFPAFAPVALAGIGDLPDTILDRSIPIKMRRRARDEKVAPFRHRDAQVDADPIRRRLAAWAMRNADVLTEAVPVMPAGVTDRPADVWEPLLAIADRAGGNWPDRARAAAVALIAEAAESTPSLGVRLLADCKTVFFGTTEKLLSSSDLAEKLTKLDEAPWGDLRGRALDTRGLARRLRPYDIRPHNVRIGAAVPKGYDRADFHDAWARYLPDDTRPPSFPPGAATSATATLTGNVGLDVADTQPLHVPLTATPAPPLTCTVTDVADVADLGEAATIGAECVADGPPADRYTTATPAPPAATTCPDCSAPPADLHRRGCPRRPRVVAL